MFHKYFNHAAQGFFESWEEDYSKTPTSVHQLRPFSLFLYALLVLHQLHAERPKRILQRGDFVGWEESGSSSLEPGRTSLEGRETANGSQAQ